MKNTTKLGISAAVLSMVAAAAAAYMYVGEGAPKRRKRVAAWMRSAEQEIVREAMKLKEATLSEDNFRRIVDVVTSKYRQAQNLTPEDIAAFIAMVTESWQKAREETRSASGTNARRSSRASGTATRGRKKRTRRKSEEAGEAS